MKYLAKIQFQVGTENLINFKKLYFFIITGLTNSISYVLAKDTKAKSNLTYSTDSNLFYINEKTGKVFLITWLNASKTELSKSYTFFIKVKNGLSSIEIKNTIRITDVNNQPPEFITSERIFEISEVKITSLNNIF